MQYHKYSYLWLSKNRCMYNISIYKTWQIKSMLEIYFTIIPSAINYTNPDICAGTVHIVSYIFVRNSSLRHYTSAFPHFSPIYIYVWSADIKLNRSNGRRSVSSWNVSLGTSTALTCTQQHWSVYHKRWMSSGLRIECSDVAKKNVHITS